MKQLTMTPELSALIKKAVGEEVDTSNLAVFEAIALNTEPLPGKNGTIFEKAVVSNLTLTQMVDYINSGNHIPLIADHELFGAPKGRVFHAGLHFDPDLELRVLFYLDETETQMIAKLNAGSLDEVSVSFLSSQFLCSECAWDYFAFGTPENIATRTCANGHTIGENGVHAEMVGLNQFIELSLVARGAADKPKIVGKSKSKLLPEQTSYRLAAKGFEPDALVVQASAGKKEETNMSDALITNLTAQVSTLTGEKAVADANVARLSADLETRTGERDALSTEVSELKTQLAAAKEEKPEDYETVKSESTAAVAFLQEQLNTLRVAKGEAKLEGDKLPTTVADLKAQIEEVTAGLVKIIPTGGVSQAATGADEQKATLKADPAAFAVRK